MSQLTFWAAAALAGSVKVPFPVQLAAKCAQLVFNVRCAIIYCAHLIIGARPGIRPGGARASDRVAPAACATPIA